jgi:hypothetical protein
MNGTHRQRDELGRPGERGSALILVLLILLALSAIGMVALQDVSRSVEQSGHYRVRSTASMFADSVAQFMSKRLGDKAGSIWNAMQTFQKNEVTDATKSFAQRSSEVTRGAYIKYTQDPGTEKDFSSLLDSQDGETGLFTGGGTGDRSFESLAEESKFSVVIRDPVDGIPVPGYSDRFCFKKVTVGTRAQVGKFGNATQMDQPRQVAVGQTVFEGLIGPLECGSN